MKVIVIIIGLLIFFAVILVFGAQIYLYARLLLGSDLLVTVHADDDRFALVHGQVSDVDFNVRGTANPFCTASCESVFKDVSGGVVIDSQTFTKKLPLQEKFSYKLEAPLKGVGQKLYEFEVICSSARTNLCRTTEDKVYRSSLVVMNYSYTEVEEKNRLAVKNDLRTFLIRTDNMIGNLIKLQNETSLTGITYPANATIDESLINKTKELNDNLKNIKDVWESGNNGLAFSMLDSLKTNISSVSNLYNYTKSSRYIAISVYNNSVISIFNIKSEFDNVQGYNVSDETNNAVKGFLVNVTEVISGGDRTIDLFVFENQVNEIENEWQDIYLSIQNDNQNPNSNIVLNGSFPVISYQVINYIEYNSSYEPVFSETKAECCVSGLCGACCGEECIENKTLYPVILLHGHSFNKRTLAEFSLDAFGATQNELKDDGFVDGAIILIGAREDDPRGILGQVRTPMTFRASYYFDIYRNTEDKVFVDTKEDNIDSYAIRLRDIVDTVRHLTNKDKVVIVTHSMGGLVTRRYMQIFGESAVDKVIFVGVPHHGITGDAERYCDILGANAECREMKDTSLFINKINNAPVPDIPMYNIIGIGCPMDDETGDGIVKNSSAYFKGAKTFYVEGTCNPPFVLLHNNLINPLKYPEVYKIVNGSLHATS